MPWALRDNLVLAGFPAPAHLTKYSWENIGMITLCNRAPVHTVVLDDRVKWWKHLPIADGQIKDLDRIVLARDTALSMMNEGHLTIIHCMAGRNRSGLIGALVLRELDNLTGAESLDLVRQLRPRSVDNIYFEEFLMSLGRPQ